MVLPFFWQVFTELQICLSSYRPNRHDIAVFRRDPPLPSQRADMRREISIGPFAAVPHRKDVEALHKCLSITSAAASAARPRASFTPSRGTRARVDSSSCAATRASGRQSPSLPTSATSSTSRRCRAPSRSSTAVPTARGPARSARPGRTSAPSTNVGGSSSSTPHGGGLGGSWARATSPSTIRRLRPCWHLIANVWVAMSTIRTRTRSPLKLLIMPGSESSGEKTTARIDSEEWGGHRPHDSTAGLIISMPLKPMIATNCTD